MLLKANDIHTLWLQYSTYQGIYLIFPFPWSNPHSMTKTHVLHETLRTEIQHMSLNWKFYTLHFNIVFEASDCFFFQDIFIRHSFNALYLRIFESFFVWCVVHLQHDFNWQSGGTWWKGADRKSHSITKCPLLLKANDLHTLWLQYATYQGIYLIFPFP